MGSVTVDDLPGGVRRLSMTNPGCRNAIDREMRDALACALSSALAEPAVAAIILTGAGGDFSAGELSDATNSSITIGAILTWSGGSPVRRSLRSLPSRGPAREAAPASRSAAT
jgi:enoyl-CoA hydratase/carnithine racemase